MHTSQQSASQRLSRIHWASIPLAAICLAGLSAPVRAAVEDELRICYDKTDQEEAKRCFADLLKRRDEFVGPEQPRKTVEEQKAESQPPAEYSRRLRDAMVRNLDPSYVTFGSGMHLGGDRTTQGMLYEAQLFHNFSWFEWPANESKRRGKFDFWLDVPVRIGVRQLTETSKPVRTPTYNPGVRLLFAQNNAPEKFDDATYFSIGAHHYSNGQEALNDDAAGRANTFNGSFNTNYVEVAAHRFLRDSPFPWTRLAFRQDFFGTWETIQSQQYPKSQLTAQARFKDVQIGPFRTSFSLSETYRFGIDYVVRPGLDGQQRPLAGERAKFGDKFQTAIDAWLHVPGSKDFALYVRYDHGYDYYNINFQNRINRLQFGIVAK